MRSILLMSLLSFIALNLRADIITLADGRTVEGEVVSEGAEDIVVKTSAGKTTIKRSEIQNIEKRKSATTIFKEKIAALAKSKESENKDEWLSLGNDAARKGEHEQAAVAFKHVIDIDSNDTVARKALGYVRSGGTWVLKSELKSKDPVEGAAGALAKEEPQSGPTSVEKRAAAAGVNNLTSADEKPVNCPRCNGTGIWITLPCLNCNKSDKPGYKKLSSGYEIDSRCGGAGKLVGLYCDVCNKTGKVLLSHITPVNGGTKAPPSGRNWCPVCHGTGIEKYSQCNQCKRSQWPGYLFFGDRVAECNNCLGQGKIAMLVCENCNKTGLVSTTQSDPNKQFGIGVGPGKN